MMPTDPLSYRHGSDFTTGDYNNVAWIYAANGQFSQTICAHRRHQGAALMSSRLSQINLSCTGARETPVRAAPFLAGKRRCIDRGLGMVIHCRARGFNFAVGPGPV